MVLLASPAAGAAVVRGGRALLALWSIHERGAARAAVTANNHPWSGMLLSGVALPDFHAALNSLLAAPLDGWIINPGLPGEAVRLCEPRMVN